MRVRTPLPDLPAVCAGCAAKIWWVRTEKDAWMPMDTVVPLQKAAPEGLVEIAQQLNHWATCPKKARFTRS